MSLSFSVISNFNPLSPVADSGRHFSGKAFCPAIRGASAWIRSPLALVLLVFLKLCRKHNLSFSLFLPSPLRGRLSLSSRCCFACGMDQFPGLALLVAQWSHHVRAMHVRLQGPSCMSQDERPRLPARWSREASRLTKPCPSEGRGRQSDSIQVKVEASHSARALPPIHINASHSARAPPPININASHPARAPQPINLNASFFFHSPLKRH